MEKIPFPFELKIVKQENFPLTEVYNEKWTKLLSWKKNMQLPYL